MKLRSKIIVVQVDQPEDVDSDGIYRAEDWKELPPTGTVTDLADDVTFVKKGDRVFFERYAALDTPFGDDMRICTEDNILAVLDEKI